MVSEFEQRRLDLVEQVQGILNYVAGTDWPERADLISTAQKLSVALGKLDTNV